MPNYNGPVPAPIGSAATPIELSIAALNKEIDRLTYQRDQLVVQLAQVHEYHQEQQVEAARAAAEQAAAAEE